MIKRLRRKFIIIATSVIFVVIGTLIGVLNITNYVRVNKDADKVLTLLADNGGVMPVPPFTHEGNPIEGFSPEVPFRTRYFTVTLNGNEIVATDIKKIAAISEETAKEYALSIQNLEKTEGYHNDYKFVKITVTNGEMIIFLDCVSELANVRSFLTISLTIGLGVIILIFILIWLFSSIAVKPIAESYEKQKRFITDANHEIKTPLAIISATNEVMEVEYGKNEWSDTVTKQIKKLNDLTEKLVFLSRMDEENANIPMAEFNLSQTINEVAEPFNSIAKTGQKDFTVSIEPDINYVGDTSLIGQLVSVLLENAFKYSTEKGSVDLSLIKRGANIKLIVGNTAENIDKNNLDKLFDRFYRPDEARNSEMGGNGIGLSIAKSIVSIHKGKITARSDDGNYIVFTVVL